MAAKWKPNILLLPHFAFFIFLCSKFPLKKNGKFWVLWAQLRRCFFSGPVYCFSAFWGFRINEKLRRDFTTFLQLSLKHFFMMRKKLLKKKLLGVLRRTDQGHQIEPSLWMCANERRENLLVAFGNDVESNRPFFFLFASLVPNIAFSCGVEDSRAISITSFWPAKERAQSKSGSARSEEKIYRIFWWVDLRVGDEGWWENPKRICSIVVMMNLPRSIFFPLGRLLPICPYYLVALSIGLSTIK